MDFKLPEIGEGVYEAEFVRWFVRPGDAVRSGQNLMEVMTDKATMELPAPFAGTIGELRAEPGQKIKVGDVVLTYTPSGAAAPSPEPAAVAAEAAATPAPPRPVSLARDGNGAAGRTAVRAAPSVRHLARKLGIDLASINGSGPEGRILIDDLSAHVRNSAAPAKKPPAPPPPDYGKPGTRVKMQGLRRKIAEHLVHAKRTIPHYSYVDECDVTELVRL